MPHQLVTAGDRLGEDGVGEMAGRMDCWDVVTVGNEGVRDALDARMAEQQAIEGREIGPPETPSVLWGRVYPIHVAGSAETGDLECRFESYHWLRSPATGVVTGQETLSVGWAAGEGVIG